MGMEIIIGQYSTFAICGVSCSADYFEITEGIVLRMKICVKKSALCKSAKLWQ